MLQCDLCCVTSWLPHSRHRRPPQIGLTLTISRCALHGWKHNSKRCPGLILPALSRLIMRKWLKWACLRNNNILFPNIKYWVLLNYCLSLPHFVHLCSTLMLIHFTVITYHLWLMMAIMFLIPERLTTFPIIPNLKNFPLFTGDTFKMVLAIHAHITCTCTQMQHLLVFLTTKSIRMFEFPSSPRIPKKPLLFFKNKIQEKRHCMSLKPLTVLFLPAVWLSISANYCKWVLIGEAEACLMFEISRQ